MNKLAIALLGAVLAVAGTSTVARAAGTLTVCLEQNTQPFSYHHAGKTSGFDYVVSEAIAKHLGEALKVVWFRIGKVPDDGDPDPSAAQNALLAAGKCQLLGGFPLIADDLKPGYDHSVLPNFTGETAADHHAYVAIGKLIASRPYHYFPFTVLLGPKAAGRKIKSLADLKGLRIGSEAGTLANAILMWYDHRRFMRDVVHYTPAKSIEHGGGLLDHLDRGDIDATLVELRRYDVYRARHPHNHIIATGFYDRIGFNMGFVATAKHAALIHRVDKAIGALEAKHELPAMAKAQGMTYVAPRQPSISPGVSLGELIAGDQ